MFNCFSQVFQIFKQNILGISDDMSSQWYNIVKKGSKGEHLYLMPKDKHTHTLIFMHGLGDTANGYLDIFNNPQVSPVTPNTKVVLLTAPIRKVTVNFGMQMTSWFDFKEFQIDDSNFEQAIGVDEIQDSSKMVKYVLQEEVAELNNKSENVFIGGFSQGACMALHCSRQFDQSLGGALIFSGFAFPITQLHEKNAKLKYLISHGKADQLLDWKRCEKSYQDHLEKDADIKWVIIDNLQHGFDQESFVAFKQFIQANFKKE